jgi:hypothetical protein
MFAVKTDVTDPEADEWTFARHKTMYGGKHIAVGDTVYVFASENEGGSGLVAKGVVTSVQAVARIEGPERQTPRVSIEVKRTKSSRRKLGRAELRPFNAWGDGRPETELNFKFYRQATNKIAGISAAAVRFLEGCFR